MAVTPTSFKTRYPAFASVADATVQAALDDAARFVGSNWFAADIDRGIMALAAHMLVTEGALAGTTGATATSGPVTSDKLGDAQTTWGGWGSSTATSEFAKTSYGLTFLRIMRANVPAVVVV